jgi:hypothetical protein
LEIVEESVHVVHTSRPSRSDLNHNGFGRLHPADAVDEITEKPLNHILANRDTLSFKLGDKFRAAKTVLRRIREQMAIGTASESPACDFHKKEPSARAQHTANLRDRHLPIGNMVQYAENARGRQANEGREWDEIMISHTHQ